MVPEGGYILLARKMLTSGIMEKPPLYLKLWAWMLLMASHTEHNGLKRGQFFTSIERMRQAMSHKVGYRKVTPSKAEIRWAYEYLSNNTMISTTKVTHGLLITILNYDEYQTPENYEQHNEQHNENSGNNTILTRMDNKKGHLDGNTRRRSRPKKETNPDVKRFIHWWTVEYRAVHGIPYHVTNSKDGALIKDLLSTHPYDKLTLMATVYLKSQDPFVKKRGYTIGAFYSQVNKFALIVQESAPKPHTIIPSDEVLRAEQEHIEKVMQGGSNA